MGEVTCPRCKGTGDIPAPGGHGVTKCFACGGRGIVDERDLAWVSKWAKEAKSVSRDIEEKTKAKTEKKPAAAKKPARPAAPKATTVKPAVIDNGRTPLHQEASDGYARGVQELLASGADVNARDNDGRTPLHWPAYRGHLEVVRLLIEHGADVNAADNSGRTPLKMATIGNHADVIALLEEHGAHL